MNRLIILAVMLLLALSVGAVRTVQLTTQAPTGVTLPSSGLTTLTGAPLYVQPAGTNTVGTEFLHQ